MRIQSGKFEGQLTEVVFLKNPDYVQWMIHKAPDNRLVPAFKRLISQLDSRQICKEKCHGCGSPATRASAYSNTPDLMFWCSKCNPYSSGARSGTLTTVDSFHRAIEHVDMTGGGNRADKREIIRNLAEAKGLPKRITEKAALEFFS